MVDTLSRRVHELHATTISMYQTDSKGKKFEVVEVDFQYTELVTKLHQKTEDYELEIDGILL